ncbi:MAG: TlpA disulfide reductase family protein [Cyclobacteriaceae bacterium]
MKLIASIGLFLIIPLIFSCQENPEKEVKTSSGIEEIETDFMKWWIYHNKFVSLSEDFIGLDEKSAEISKEDFLGKLITGHYIPLKIKSDRDVIRYKLHRLDDAADKSIGITIKNESLTSLRHFRMEGATVPEFNLTDMNGNSYTSENIRGKTLVLKTWFISCVACVKEFPELNELVDNFEERNDVVFLSLALDTEEKLEKFLAKKKFSYPVVPEQKTLITEELNLHIYPTHLVINGDGKIMKVVNKASELISYLNTYKALSK